jgi:F-type H+-transporting ATPase subunit b
MARLRQRFWGQAVLALAMVIAIVPAGALRAQESAKPESSVASPAAQAEQKSEKAEGQEKVKEGGEADAIRNAPAVKFIARHTGLTNNQAYWLCIILNFAVIFFAIGGLLRKMLPGYFNGRTATIQKGIEEARKMSEDARRRLADVEGRLSRLDTEIAGMKQEADENAKAEEQRRIVISAEQEIEMAANTARRELKSYVAELAVELAEKKIRVTKDADEALVRAFTAQLGKDGN